MPRTRGEDGSIIMHNHVRCGFPTSMHGRLAIKLGSIPYSGSSPLSRFSHSSNSSLSRQSIASRFIHHSTHTVPHIGVGEQVLHRRNFVPALSKLSHLHVSTSSPYIVPSIQVQSPIAPTVQSFSDSIVPPTFAPRFTHSTSLQFFIAPLVQVPPQLMQMPVQSSPTMPVQLTPPPTHHNIHDVEDHRDGSGRVIIRLMGKG